MRLVKTDQWCLMFLRAWKNKKIADAVLAQVYPLLNDVGRFARCSPSTLASDKYVLGFFCANIGVEMRRAAGGPLPAVQQGTIMFLVLQQLFGKNAVSASEIGDLLTGSPTPNEEFSRGCDAALTAALGKNDPGLLGKMSPPA